MQVRTLRVKLPNGSVRLVEPDFAGRLNGFTLLFEALTLTLARQMPFHRLRAAEPGLLDVRHCAIVDGAQKASTALLSGIDPQQEFAPKCLQPHP